MIEEITDRQEKEKILLKTGLSIHRAGTHETDDPIGSFWAAHNDDHSVFYLVFKGEETVWVMAEGDKAHRKNAADAVRATLMSGELG